MTVINFAEEKFCRDCLMTMPAHRLKAWAKRFTEIAKAHPDRHEPQVLAARYRIVMKRRGLLPYGTFTIE